MGGGGRGRGRAKRGKGGAVDDRKEDTGQTACQMPLGQNREIILDRTLWKGVKTDTP